MDMQSFLRAFLSARLKINTRRKCLASSPSRNRGFALALDKLEDRLLLSANLALTSGSVVNSSGQPLTSISAGQVVTIKGTFSTAGLPSNASYHISFTVNGLTQPDSNVTYGAGVAGTETWNADSFGFYASPGTNQVTVTIDPDHSVAESSFTDNTFSFTFNAASPAVGVVSSTVAQVRNFYGVNSIPNFGTSSADGSGQTIALIDGANEPTILSDLDGFDKAMSATTTSTQTLFDQYGAASSFVTVYNQFGVDITKDIANSGSNGVPAMDPTGHWEGEETLDAEWAHAMAPGAKLVIIEVNDDSSVYQNLLAGNAVAANLPGVTVVSNSWGMSEFDGETADDSSIFVTPQGHPGVTFLTASNDNGSTYYGAHGPNLAENSYYPATSPNVVSVGGTQITLNNDGYGSETGWSFPTPATTLNFGSSVQTGSWQSHSGGFNGNYGVAAPGDSNSATWTIPITPTNTGFGTEVSATWIAAAGNATNATYNVYDGSSASGTLLGTISVDQTQAPAGTADGNRQFQELGVFFPTLDDSGDGTLTVVLSSSGADGNVVADAVGAAQGWASSGGPTTFETEPSYQTGVQSTGQRTTPDVSLISSQFSGVTMYFQGALTYDGNGTSLACPCWAGLIAVVNQGRVAAGGASLNTPDNPQQTLQALYSLPSSDYHDITSGYNGYFAGPGYDLVTGLGTPITNLLVPAMVAFGLPDVTTQVTLAQQPSGTIAGQPISHASAITPSVIVDVLDIHGNIAINDSSNVTITLIATNGATLGGTTTIQAINGVATFTDLSIDTVGTGYRLSITDDALTPATSSTFAVTPDLASSQLSFSQTPAATLLGQPLAPTLVIKAVDQFGNAITTDHSKIILSTNAGSFTGTNAVTLANGIATFSNLIFKTAGDYTLTATPATNSTLAITTPITFDETITPASTVIPTPTVKAAGYAFGAVIPLTDTLTSNVPSKTIPFNSTASKPTLVIAGTDNIAATSFTAAGAAKFTVPVLDAGSYLCQIVYPGDTNHASSSGSTFTLVINKATTTTTLAASTSSLVFGQTLTLTATVKSSKTPASIARPGSVEFLDNGVAIPGSSTVALNASSNAAFTFTPTATGSHNYTAIYLGSTDFIGSTSAAKKLTVNKDKTAIQITSPAPKSSISRNQTFNLDVQVSVIAPGADTLTGDLVTIKDNGKPIGTITLNSAGAGSLPGLSYTASGTHSLTALFAGDTVTLTATSSALKLTSS